MEIASRRVLDRHVIVLDIEDEFVMIGGILSHRGKNWRQNEDRRVTSRKASGPKRYRMGRHGARGSIRYSRILTPPSTTRGGSKAGAFRI
jgi:hypothetical protein